MDPFPENQPGAPGPGSSATAREQVNAPAILLMVTAGLGVLMALIGLAQSVLGLNRIPPEMFDDPNIARYRSIIETAQGIGGFSNVITLLLSGLTFFGALKMKNLENFGLSMAAAIIAIIPCFGPCCCLGIPVGIWALVVINKPEVKSAFRG
ncbi:hypothetical protein D187_010271 [Cystobacter fuscus DSM 2262]|uniref:DUF4064 domain-containing protein n=1 Tax=Cystobacter fuscus (strain ATCC 25194 / DSM 2262 / NBRC 100088 / M29) TaxID=1242864 RepID=S9PGY5_CYSF2|nr:hypothetical protein [Cystobacter fuscus]EPX61652.1 hypothetical protein D187_010271 [Cystobacter fuscus DSM 2262]